MGLDREYSELLHELFRRSSSAFDTKGYNTAASVRHILHSHVIVLVTRKGRIIYELCLRGGLEEFSQSHGIRAVLLHANMQTLKTKIQIICVLRRLNRSEIAHELSSRLCDKRALLAEFLRICDTVIAVIRSRETRELVSVGHPVESA